jgi:hypothetical protein
MLAVAFSSDGALLAGAGRDGSIRLWDAHTGTLRGVLGGHEEAITSLAFAPDGRTLAAGSDDHAVTLYPLAGGQGDPAPAARCRAAPLPPGAARRGSCGASAACAVCARSASPPPQLNLPVPRC